MCLVCAGCDGGAGRGSEKNGVNECGRDLSPNDMIALRPVSEIDVVMADDVMLEGGSLHQEPGSLLIQPVWR